LESFVFEVFCGFTS